MITQRERKIVFDPLKDPFAEGGTRLEGGGFDRAGFEHGIFQTGPWINMNPFKTNTRD